MIGGWSKKCFEAEDSVERKPLDSFRYKGFALDRKA
jgi:hypothetical protein